MLQANGDMKTPMLAQILGAVTNMLPMIFGIDGIWYSIIVAEFMALTLSAIFILIKKNKYHYL